MICKKDDPVFESSIGWQSVPADWEKPSPKMPMRQLPEPKQPLKTRTLFECSLLIPGLGQFLLGRIGSGFGHLLAGMIVWALIMAEIFIWKLNLTPTDLWPIAMVHLLAALNAWAIAPTPTPRVSIQYGEHINFPDVSGN